MSKKTIRMNLAFIIVLLIAGCSADKNQDNVSANDVAVMAVSEDRIANQTYREGNTLPENTEQGAPSVFGQTPSENEAQEEDDGVYYTMEEVKTLDIPENMLAYWLVLNSKIPFISANEGCQEFFWEEYFWRLWEPTSAYQTSDFGIVDLDSDGEEELVMTGYMPETTQVLDYQDGKVYSYQFVFRGMARICIDGVYGSSSGSDIGGFHRIHLDKGSYEEETLAYMDGDYFEVEGVEVSSDEFYAYTSSFIETEMIETLDFTEDMINSALLGDLDESILDKMENMKPEEICDENNLQMADVPEVYQGILTGSEEFICVTDDSQKYMIDGNCVIDAAGEDQGRILYLSIADMDGDGKEEVILVCHWNHLVLHENEGVIYGYVFDYWDEMAVMAKDGVFQSQREDYDQYRKIVSFAEDGCEIEEVDYDGDINDDRIRYYYFSEDLIERYSDAAADDIR